MQLPISFTQFLKDIRPTPTQRGEIRDGHQRLRKRLREDADVKSITVSSFLQGSYRRATLVRPKGNSQMDVDVILVTKLAESEYEPEEVMALFVPFLDRHYKGKWVPQGRSFGITMSDIQMDLVITSAPSESEEGCFASKSVEAIETLDEDQNWRLTEGWLPLNERSGFTAERLFKAAQARAEWELNPLRIPDREVAEWTDTHPLAQIQATRDKNKVCGTHFINVVKSIKWWRKEKHPDTKHPKGYPLEHLCWTVCPDDITCVDEGIVLTLEAIANNCSPAQLWVTGRKPYLPDHGVADHDVFKRITAAQYAEFHEQVCAAAVTAREAWEATDARESALKWRELFGNKFPVPEADGKSTGGFTQRTAPGVIPGGRFA